MIPTGRQVALWGVPLGLAVLAVGADVFVPAVIAFDVLLVGLLVVDGLRTRANLEIERSTEGVMAVGGSARVGLRVSNRGPRTVSVAVHDEAPGPSEGLPAHARLPPQGRLDVDYRVTIDRRGRHAFGDVIARVTSPWGLWERQVRQPVDTTIKVFPAFQQLEGAGLAARITEQRAPARARRQAGGENEFQRLRPYVAGDSYRHVDWKATARLGRPITREYGQESNQNVIFLLDAGRMMSAPMGTLTAFDHALNAALLLGQTALRKGDRVGLLAFDDAVRAWVTPKGGRTSSRRLIQATYDLEPSLREPDHAVAFRHLAIQVRRRSLVVVFVSIVDRASARGLVTMVRGLARRHVPLVVWMRDPELDQLLDEGDLFEAAATAEVFTERAEVLAELQRAGALVVDARVGDLTAALVARYVEVKARRLL